MKKRLFPVLLGADLNCYSMARAFHEKFGVISEVFAKDELGPIRYSRIIRFHKWPSPFSRETALSLLLHFARKKQGVSLVLIGCTDEYARFIIENKALLCAAYFCPYPDRQTAQKIINKDSFYEAADQYGLPHPKTLALSSSFETSKKEIEKLGYPLVIKPTSSVSYWEHPFPGMKKVYIAYSWEETVAISRTVFASGYPERLVFQSFVEGDDSEMNVVTCYSDKNGQVRMMAPARVLLEDHSPKALGNHAAVLTCKLPKVTNEIKTFLNGIGYIGFSNFDIKRDKKTGKYLFLEVNLRQGRSNYYLTGSRINPADLILRDMKNDWGNDVLLPTVGYFWHTIPTRLVYKYVKEPSLLSQVEAAVAKGKESDSLFYRFDLKHNLRRKAFVFLHNRNYRRKYRKYFPKSSRK